ncbi:MAG: ATP-grasp domain-containing protein [Actinomycetota bacterium]|nr:ATP-grasp domain-containing protein [Actinomycetota bacterium]
MACRIQRTLRRLEIESIAVYSDADAEAKHVREADRSVHIGDPPPAASYLNAESIIRAALESRADGIHPGYGFLSENASFARAVTDAGLAWVGPPPEVLELAGDKVAARRVFEESGFPVLPGAGPFADEDTAIRAARDLGYPVMVKAVFGGGGIGMGVAKDESGLRKAVATAATRAERFFGDPAIYIERYVPHARHVEVQILADDERTIHLYERDCSVQRRHQKVIEETPSPGLVPRARRGLFDKAIRSMEAIGYRGAGTVECILSPEGEFYFLEVNARLQVEHPVTEMITGVDLVEEQLRIAAGEGMSMTEAPTRHGHAIEFRIYAEDPDRFLPSPGRISQLSMQEPLQEWRFDLGYDAGDEVPMFYDPLVGKAIIRRGNRELTLSQAQTLEGLRIEGVKTNIPSLLRVLHDDRFRSGEYDTGLLGQ